MSVTDKDRVDFLETAAKKWNPRDKLYWWLDVTGTLKWRPATDSYGVTENPPNTPRQAIDAKLKLVKLPTGKES